MNRLATALALCAAAATGAAQSTTATRSVPAAPAVIERLKALGYAQGAVIVTSTGPEGAVAAQTGAASAEKKPSPRLEKLKKLEYDRRPSAIFEAWASPPAEAKPEPLGSSGSVSGSASSGSSASGSSVPDSSASVSPDLSGPPAVSPPTDPTPEQLEAARKAAEEAAKKVAAEAETARKKAEDEAIDAEMSALQRNVTLGDWAAVKTYLTALDPDDHKAAYQRLLESLRNGPSKRPNDIHPQGQQFLERNRFAPADVLGLAAAGPRPLEKTHLQPLGQILRQSIDQGHRIELLLAELTPTLDAENAPLARRQLALVLVAANEPLFLDGLVPTAAEAEAASDREALNLISRLCLAKHADEGKTKWLEEAWRATLAALAAGDIETETKQEAIQRAVEIAPRIQKELGQAWLDESFTERPERGREVLAAIGSSTSLILQRAPQDQDQRLRLLELQSTAAEALLAAAPERADEWARELALMAGNWLREAQWTYQNDTSSSLGPRMERDPWGNIYWYDDSMMRRGGVPAIATARILDLVPSDGWLVRVDDTLRPRLHGIVAQLLLKASEEAKAFPHIEGLALTHPREAEALVAEFLRVWARNNNPNDQNNRRSRFVYSYGFDERAAGIPLTRSQQERNLKELAQWVVKLRALPVELPDNVLADAFTAAHSQAEIYRLETIEQVFGPLDGLEPGTLASLVQRMRTNLTTIWNDPAVQRDKKTRRGQKELQAEVLRGYELARSTVAHALESHPASWQLHLAQASLLHDENDYRHELQKDAEFSTRRQTAFEGFARAAQAYVAGVAGLEKHEHSAEAWETWFYAALGACDLRAVNHERQLAPQEIQKIRASLTGIAGSLGERHLELFANSLVTRMGSVSPAVKQRYVREGLAITGELDLVRDVRKVHDYYGDLVTEIQLRASVDGSDQVGHSQPFGLRVDLRHTRDIERESGGFGKYLQNQNAAQFSWNYGRPTEDYRDKFEEMARTALSESFEVLSVTFNEPAVRSRAEAEYGWRVTPYAYLLLKPRGPEVDRVPGLRMDLDFLDVTGYVVLPVESPIVPIDATGAEPGERPASGIALTQTLDERQAKNGKLVLELKATATGLVPPLEQLVELDHAGFEVAAREDTGVAVTKFAEEGEGVLTERTWTVTLTAQPGQTELPTKFRFGEAKVETASHERFRYVDADLEPVGEEVQLERRYGEPSRAWMWWVGGGVLLLGLGVWAALRFRPRRLEEEGRWRVPEPLTPFTVLGLLRDIERNDGLAPTSKRELAAEIAQLERHYFGDGAAEPLDLRRIAEDWTAQAS